MAVQPPLCDFDWEAVDFRLKGIDGRIYGLDDIRGPRGTLVMFICNHCPYVKAVVDRIVRDARDLEGYGVGSVAIMPNDTRAYPEDDFENMKRFAADNAFPFPYLIDETQEIARAYDAVCTPDFFGFNKDMKLQYRGRLDASRKEIGPADLRRDLYEAMVMVALFGKGPTEQQPSIGCTIKWKISAFQV